MTANTKNAPGIRGNGPEGSDHNPTHQDGAEVMSTVPQTTDQKIDAALQPEIHADPEYELPDGASERSYFVRFTPDSGVVGAKTIGELFEIRRRQQEGEVGR